MKNLNPKSPFIFKAFIKIDPSLEYQSTEPDECSLLFDPINLIADQFCVSVVKSDVPFCDDEYSEMRGINYVYYKIALSKICQKQSHVVHYHQLFSSTALLLNSVTKFSVSYHFDD